VVSALRNFDLGLLQGKHLGNANIGKSSCGIQRNTCFVKSCMFSEYRRCSVIGLHPICVQVNCIPFCQRRQFTSTGNSSCCSVAERHALRKSNPKQNVSLLESRTSAGVLRSRRKLMHSIRRESDAVFRSRDILIRTTLPILHVNTYLHGEIY
jgi:hypothetical protein